MIIALATLSGIGLSLVLFRYFYTGERLYFFLLWNLFLAAIPAVISYTLVQNPLMFHKKRYHLPVLAVWLLFFPNAPYIISDYIHLRLRTNIPIWYDFLLISVFAFTGLWLGFWSLLQVRHLVRHRYGKRTAEISVAVILFLSGFGIYLGRFERWNSWDIIRDPLGLFADIAHALIYPWEHPSTWAVTLVFGSILYALYVLIYWNARWMDKKL